MFVLLEMIIRHPSAWEDEGHPAQGGAGTESSTSSSQSASSNGGIDGSSSRSSGNGRSSGGGSSSSGGGSRSGNGGAQSSSDGNNRGGGGGGGGGSGSRSGNLPLLPPRRAVGRWAATAPLGRTQSSSDGSSRGGGAGSNSDSKSSGNIDGGGGGGAGHSSGGGNGKGMSSRGGGGGDGNTTTSSSSSGRSAIGNNVSRDSTIQLDASKRGRDSSSLVAIRRLTSAGPLLAPLHLLVSLTHPSRCSPAVHASSMAAALPLLGALRSIAKVIPLSGVVFLGPAARVEPFYLVLLLSKHAFQLLEGKLIILPGNAGQQPFVGERPVPGAKPEERDHHGQLQQQPQPLQGVSCQIEVTAREICRAFLWAGFQLLGRATTAVHLFANTAGVLSFECVKNQQLAERMVAAAPLTYKTALQQMLQQARCSAKGGAMGQQEEEACIAVAGGAAHGGTGAAAAAKRGARGTAATAEGGGREALTVAAGGAGGTAAERGGSSAGGTARGEPPAVPAATLPAPVAAKAEATAAADLMEVSAVSLLYPGLQGLCMRADGMAALIGAERIARNQLGLEPLKSGWLFSEQHGDYWQRVIADTEEGMEPPGRLIGALLQSAAAFEDMFKLVIPDELLIASDYAAPLKQLQMLGAKDLVHSMTLDRITAHERTQEPSFAVSAARYIQDVQIPFNNFWELFEKLAWSSFCCGNPKCRVMKGSSEVGLVMGGAAARGGGGYCLGCRRVCYCSEACQRVCWEAHKGVCRRYRKEKAALDG